MRHRGARWAAASLASLCLLTGCGSGTEADTAAVLEPLLRSAPAFQRELLEDGELTHAEYERAVLATVECMHAAGLEVSELQRSDDPPRLHYFYRVPETGGQGLASAADDCFEEYLSQVLSFWEYLTQPSEEALARKRREAAACMRAAGHDLPSDPTQEELLAVYERDVEGTGECAAGLWGQQFEMPVFPSDGNGG